jgi:cephalosporin hydroxylase
VGKLSISRNAKTVGNLMRAGPTKAFGSWRIAQEAIELGAMQKLRELAPLLAYAQRRPPKTVVEIGAGHGGSFYAWTRIAESDALIVSIDDPQDRLETFRRSTVPKMRSYLRAQQRGEVIIGDSHDPDTKASLLHILEGASVDFLFIDGDHTYGGVKEDFHMYAPLARLVALHDILPHPDEPHTEVDRFWHELEPHHRTVQFVDDHGQFATLGGIGIVFFD